MSLIFGVLDAILDVAWWIVIAHALMSWLIAFSVLDPHQQFVRDIWNFLERLLYPAYSRIRAFMPRTGAVDLSPLVLLFIIILLQRVLIPA